MAESLRSVDRMPEMPRLLPDFSAGSDTRLRIRKGVHVKRTLFLILSLAIAGCDDDDNNGGMSPSPTNATGMSFFVTSATSTTGNLGGLAGADATCQRLATAVGQGARTWRAYLSVERDAANGNQTTHARDRIGAGPWRNAGDVVIANNVAELHARSGDAALFVDERGQRINGQWTGSPSPVEHDILTGSNADGTVAAGFTCADWTSASDTLTAWVGHSDGLGPSQNATPPLNSWNAAHLNQNCANTAPRGGAGRFYCFAR
jgi:hypothetical protein